MRVVILGGTRFIGRAIVEELAAADHQLLIVHRGHLEPDDLLSGVRPARAPAQIPHLHCDRAELVSRHEELAAFDADLVVDCRALTHADAEVALQALPDVRRWIVISSLDVYRAFGALNDNRETDPVPLDEESPVRTDRYPYRGKLPDRYDYDKLDVEDVYLPRGASVFRLPMVYGERDYQRREEFILRRVRAGRKRIPFGAGTWLACRVYVRDVARAVRLAVELGTPPAASPPPPHDWGGVLNLCEDRTYSVRMWARMILEAAGSDAELVRVADDLLPDDLQETGSLSQHIAATSGKARAVLGWSTSDPFETLKTTVRWHLAHAPADASADFTADDRALESV